MSTNFAGTKFYKHNVLETADELDKAEEEEEDEDSAETGSTTSFSLQECINEFRARRIRRVSTQSRDRDMPLACEVRKAAPVNVRSSADADLIKQNRCNKEQERKCKPCKNGFCYCFTSDSGDCASIAPTRETHVRQHRRSRRSESNKTGHTQPPTVQRANNLDHQQQCRRRSVPPNIKLAASSKLTNSNHISPLKAESSLLAVGEDAPLIHIIQELRDNCVISEVRVNKQKLQRSSVSCEPVAHKMQPLENVDFQPTAPALSNISEQETPLEESQTEQTSASGSSLQSNRRSSLKSSRRSSGGRLLQKRLCHGQVNFKPRDVKYPPPKPPRRSTQSLDGKHSLSSLTSTTPSVREAEKVLDEFLRQRGVQLPVASPPKQRSQPKSKRKSYPQAEVDKHFEQLPSCPSLSDIERVVASKRGSHYAKNIHKGSSLHHKNAVADKPMKEVMLGWAEPKIADMLNYEGKSGRSYEKQYKSQASQAAPQSAVGWQAPPKISLDTVDGAVSENLAANMEQKHTPIKYPRGIKSKHGARASQKFIWGEQWRNLSPWNANKRTHKTTSLRSKSKSFLNNSKIKILRFVSPKKSNQKTERSIIRLCTVGVQTSQLDLSQSPPGSYHSPVQSCRINTTPSATTTSTLQQPTQQQSSEQPYFDFERKVKPPTPPKKLPRAQRARKLDFHEADSSVNCAPTTTYRSYHKELDHDVTINKMGYLLGSIRAKLEASDERAMRTFQECSRFAEQQSFDYPDSQRVALSRHRRGLDWEPIYSEIEEDCFHISGSPHYESRTAAKVPVATTPTTVVSTSMATPSPAPPIVDINALYAQVQKKSAKKPTEATPLGQFLQESLRNGSFFKFMPLPDEPSSESGYTLSTLPTEQPLREASLAPELCTPPLPAAVPTTSLHQSLNNIHEQHSPPKNNRNLSKSELSLQRSEIFLENLCRSEMVLDHDDNVRLEKVENTALRANNVAVDSVSYDLPHECRDDFNEYALEDDVSSYASNAHCQYGSAHIEPPHSDNQSTPKKQNQRFTTKPSQTLSIDTTDGPAPRTLNISHSCPTTPQQQASSYTTANQNSQHAHSCSELTPMTAMDSQLLSTSALARYRLLKDALRRSYRKGKNFFKTEKQRLTHSFSFNRDQSNQTDAELDSSSQYASFNLDTLMNDSLSTVEQLAQAVSICRQMPELEISAEMVEAERLLLFSSLRQQKPLLSVSTLAARRKAQSFLIDAMHLPVKADASQDMFFNYYYICTFECEGRISSTQSVECQNGAALFRDCGIEFYSTLEAEVLELRCQIFMLRLRKVSTLSLEPQKKRSSLGGASSNSNSSNQSEHIVSRFRLHASFTLHASDMRPYQLVCSESQQSANLFLRNSSSWQLPLTMHTKSSNLAPQITLTGRSELRLPKLQHAGYLNVQDPKSQHSWNRRWCTLLGLELAVWQHEDNLTEQPPLLSIGLQHCGQTHIETAPRELCARVRSFMLQCGDDQYYFASDTQTELNEWLEQLNEALSLAQHWLHGN